MKRSTQPVGMLALKLSGSVKLRPQETDRALRAVGKTIMLDDESLRTTVIVTFATLEDRNSFNDTFPVLVLQRRDGASRAWEDVYTFYDNSGVRIPEPMTLVDPRIVVPPQLDLGFLDEPTIPVPEDPRRGPQPKRPELETPTFVATGPTSLTFNSSSLTLPEGTSGIRVLARRANGASWYSRPLQLDVRKTPAILTLLAMGGTCTDPDANTTYKDLDEAGITRDIHKCNAKGVAGTYLGDLTPMSSVNCNNPCNSGCTNFFEHLALRIMNDRNLANEIDSINNPGTQLCRHRTNQAGIRNRIVFGKWRNTEEEPVCSTPIKFNTIIDDFVSQGGRSLILIGQSQGGAKLAGMVRDNWRWGNDLTLELIVLWDATSLDVLNGFDTGHVLITSMGVRKVGNKPKKVLNFCQYSNLIPFQNGAPLDPSEHHEDLEEHDLNGCFSHNGIARSQFVHHRTTEVVRIAVQSARDRTRM